MNDVSTEQATAAEERAPYQWGFLSASLVLLALAVVGQGVGVLLVPYIDIALGQVRLHGWSGIFQAPAAYSETVGFGARDLIFAGFLVSSVVYIVLMRRAIQRFFRSMVTGVSLVVMITLAVVVGVLVPQLEDVENPEYRVNAQNYQENFNSFAWAEGYFLYHLGHVFGRGLPEGEIPPNAAAGLERFGQIYGEEEASNREKMMRATFGGQEKTAAIEQFIYDNGETLHDWFDFVTALHLNRTYKSHWFATLMVLLLVAVAFNTFKGNSRQWFSVAKFGFFSTHLGVMTLLIGGGVSHLLTDRGILHLDLREGPQDTYWRHYDKDNLSRMPFAVGLDHFARRDWPQIQVEFPDEEFTSRPPQYTLWEGRKIEVDRYEKEDGGYAPGFSIRVKELHDHAVLGTPRIDEGYDEAEPDLVYPVAEVEVPDFSHGTDDGHNHPVQPTKRILMRPASAFAGERTYYDPNLAFRLKAAWGTDDASEFPPNDRELGDIWVEVAGINDGNPVRFPVMLDERYSLPGGYTMTVVSATANFQLDGPTQREIADDRPLAEQPPREPVVKVSITGPDGGTVEERPIFHRFDADEQGLQSKFVHSSVITRLRWDTWRAPGPPRYVLHWGLDDAPRLVSQTGEVVPVEVGKALALPGDTAMKPLNFVTRAEPVPNLEFVNVPLERDGWDSAFYSRDPRGVTLEVVRYPGTDREEVHEVNLASFRLTTEAPDLNSVWASPDGRCEIYFFENDKMLPYEWRSVLSVYEPDGDGKPYKVPLGSEMDREIRVNDYFTYGGYRFFQTNAIAELPTYSGIGVVYDPGIPIVLVGMYTIIFGTAWVFLVRPIVLARRKRRATA